MKLSAKGWRTIVWMGLLAALLVPAASKPQDLKNDFIVYGGDVVTMDKAGTVAEAVWVRDGKIEAVGKREEVMRLGSKTTERIDLHGSALLPGFIDPHLHLDLLALMSFYTDLSPCLPAWYETRKHCQVTILDALKFLKQQNPKPEGSPWIVGNGIDPSRMTLDKTQPSSLFHNNPAWYIEHYVSATRPVIILDQSGHLAYANRQAFVQAGICATPEDCGPKTAKKEEPASPGQWDVGKNGLFTGLLIEQQSYNDFQTTIPLPTPEEMVHRAEIGSQSFARAGVTTMVNGGTGTNGNVALFQALAARSRNHPLLRYRALVPWNGIPQGLTKPSPWDEQDDGLFGVTGIKVWSDGSLQGCTGGVKEPYAKDGSCQGAQGMEDFTSASQISTDLAPLWRAGWPIQIHANGDQAILEVLNALAALQVDTRNDSPITLLHFTLDGNPASGEDMVKQVADLRAGRFVINGKTAPPVDVHVSHLIGHVAYWGGAFENILDGIHGPGRPDEKGRAARIDATRHEIDLGVPFSLHSDASVTPVHPLWYVEQAVTRNTWFYPKLKETDAHLMPGKQNVTIAQALEAVTIEPARQTGIDRYVGSIEKGKVADLVILDKNPLKQPPNEIHLIKVLSTFVGGYRNDWSKEP